MSTFWDGNFSKVSELFDENGQIKDPAYPGRIDEFLKEVIWVWCRCDTPGRTFRLVTIVGNG